MIRVLVVEDDTEKLGAILQVLRAIDKSEGTFSIEYAIDVVAAKRLLSDTAYDLVVLDIALPNRIGEVINLRGGIELLREIAERPGFKMPGHVVGLTAHDEILDEAAGEFANSVLTVLRFSHSEDSWSRPLQRLAANVRASRDSSVPTPSYRSFLGVVCALEMPEFESILSLPWAWSPQQLADDFTTYFEGHFVSQGQSRRVIAACAGRKGMPSATVLASKLISLFRPQYLVMTGITAGVANRVNVGDVIGAEMCWDWGSGKWVRDAGGMHFLQSPFQVSIHPELRDRLNRLAADSQSLLEVEESWPGPKPDTRLALRLGPVASGAAVLSDLEKLESVKDQHRELVGAEMEVYGVFVAAQEGLRPEPRVFSLKSVVDFADGDKSDEFHAYAAHTSSRLMKIFVEKYL